MLKRILLFSIILNFVSNATSLRAQTGELIVVFKPTATQQDISDIQRMISADELDITPLTGARLWRVTFPVSVPCATGRCDVNSIDSIAGIIAGATKSQGVGKNSITTLPPTSEIPTLSYAQMLPNCPAATEAALYPPLRNPQGRIRVAVLDAGIDAGHPEFNGYLDLGHSENFIGGSNTNLIDSNGHGTAVAGIITRYLQALPGSSLQVYKVLDARGTGTLFGIIKAIDQAVLNGAQLINLSSTTNIETNMPNFDINQTPLGLAIEQAQREGVLVIGAAGNDALDLERRGNEYYLPALQNPNIIVVGSVGCENEASSFSNYGDQSVDVFTQGENVVTTAAQNPMGNLYKAVSGTSFAAPIVTGIAAQLWAQTQQRSSDDWKRVKNAILCSTPSTGLICRTGGVVNAIEAEEIFYQNVDCGAANLVASRNHTTVAEEKKPIETPTQTTVLQVSIAPNPMSETAVVRLQTPQKGFSILTIYDAMGNIRYSNKQNVAANEWVEMPIPANQLTTGFYICKITVNEQTVTKKIIVK
ncbi:MAG: hypothetical protein RL757_3183 [Bacteroidota bacterium]|jgi:hypothetical protein